MGKTNKQLRKLWPELKSFGIQRCMFIDPGLGGTGWAYFHNLKLDAKAPFSPYGFSGVIRSDQNGGKTWQSRADNIARHFASIMKNDFSETRYLFIEFPVVWSNSHKSMTSTQKGELFKLSYLSGMLAFAADYLDYHILFSPGDWKGQLPKQAVISRIKKQWPDLGKIRDHEADAIGMGLAFQGGL